MSTGLILSASLPRFHDGASAEVIQNINQVLAFVFTGELCVRLLSYGTFRECITDVYLWMDLVALASDYVDMVGTAAHT